jgi:ABC-type glycerol-3-phosphate transport system substrate-binding protein
MNIILLFFRLIKTTWFCLAPALLLAACSELPISGGTITPEPSPTATSTPAPTPELTRTPARPATVRIWVPPQFDLLNNTPASRILEARLNEFTTRRSGISVEVRVKALTGPGGILDSLTTANAAAPLALPDLVLVPRPILETAALKGLLFPIDNMVSPLDDGDWYSFAQQLAHLQNSTFGLPFAGDALILVYRPAVIEEPPRGWAPALENSNPLIFPAADEQAYFTLTEYMAAGGKTQDEEGRPILEAGPLTEVLAFYQAAETAGVMPFWLTQYATDQQAWDAYSEAQSNMVITWSSRFLSELPVDSAALPIPTPEGSPFTLANGWVWALSNPQVERHASSIELAEFLTASDFLSRWTAAAGYLPPRSSALEGWSNTTLQNLAEEVARSAHIFPPTDAMSALSPALQQAALEVLKEQMDPETAAQEAIELVAEP